LPQRDIRFRVYRQVIEILDWMLLLRPYQPARSTEHAKESVRRDEPNAGASAEASRAVILADALRNWNRAQRGGNRQHEANRFVPAFTDSDDPPIPVDWASELCQLIEIARHFRHTSVVHTPAGTFGSDPA
jgi:hypothetical protein